MSQFECYGCAAGKHGKNLTSGALATSQITSDHCIDCEAELSLYSGVGYADCATCDRGQFQYRGGSATCISCEDGCPVSATCETEFNRVCLLCNPGGYLDKNETTGDSRCAFCPTGYFSNAIDSALCTKCQPGYYQSKKRQQFCPPCDPGTYNGTTGAIVCSDCNPGKYSGIASRACKFCEAGKYANEVFGNVSGSNTTSTIVRDTEYCTDCVIGQYRPVGDVGDSAKFSSKCSECEDGKIQTEVGQAVCVACPPSHYRPTDGEILTVGGVLYEAGLNFSSNQCIDCPEGFYCSDGFKLDCGTGTNVATYCPAMSAQAKYAQLGFYTIDSYNNSECPGDCSDSDAAFHKAHRIAELECPAGYECSNGVLQPCREGTYCPKPGMSSGDSCKEVEGFFCPEPGMSSKVTCPLGTQCSSGEAAIACSLDQIGKDGICSSCPDTSKQYVLENECVTCPVTGVTCDGTITPQPDFFMAKTGQIKGETRLYKCKNKGVCVIRPTNFTEIKDAQGNVRLQAERPYEYETVCVDSKYSGVLCGICKPGYGKATDSCVECPSKGTIGFIIFIFCLLAIGAPMYLVKCALSPDFKQSTVCKSFLNFLMATGLLGKFNLDWGGTLSRIFSATEAASGGTPPLLECMGISFHGVAAFSFCLPFFVLLAPAAALLAWKGYSTLRGHKGEHIWGAKPYEFYVVGVISLSYVAWPVAARQALRVMDCSVEIEDVYYMASDLSVVCDPATSYGKTYALATFTLVVVIPAFPLIILYCLIKFNSQLYEGLQLYDENGKMMKHTQSDHRLEGVQLLLFLYGGFKPKFFFWEVLVMFRKLMLVCVIVFMANAESGFQVYCGVWAFLAAFILELQFEPYQAKICQRMELLSLCSSMVSLLLGMALLLGQDQETGETTYLSETSSNAIKIMVIFINFAVMLVFGSFFVKQGVKLVKKELHNHGQKEAIKAGIKTDGRDLDLDDDVAMARVASKVNVRSNAKSVDASGRETKPHKKPERDEWGEFPDSEDSAFGGTAVNPVYDRGGGLFGDSGDDSLVAGALAAEFAALAGGGEDEKLDETENPMLTAPRENDANGGNAGDVWRTKKGSFRDDNGDKLPKDKLSTHLSNQQSQDDELRATL
jgi:hypothetical protein